MRGSVDVHAVEADAERQWASDAAIRGEFQSKAAYVAYRRADAQGLCRIFSGGTKRTYGGAPSAEHEPPAMATLAQRQAQVRQENVGRAFAGLPPLPIPQQ